MIESGRLTLQGQGGAAGGDVKAEPARQPWNVDTAAARALQEQLRASVMLRPPAGFAPRLAAGADVSMERWGRVGYGGIVVVDLETMETVDQASSRVELTFPYVPGLLSFRELPVLEVAWDRLHVRPDVMVFDGQGLAHPRRFGLACHGGVLFGIPSVGCAKTLLVGSHGPLGEARGDTAALVDAGEVVGAAVRTRHGARPVFVSPGHLMDTPTAVDLVLRLGRFREPETTRRAHRLVNERRRNDE